MGDQALAKRIGLILPDETGLSTKRMFGAAE